MEELKTHKSIQKSLLAGFVAFLVLGLIVFCYKYLYPDFKKNDITPTPLPISNKLEYQYKKYVNKKIGYEVTIPDNMVYEEKMDGNFVTIGNKIIIYLLDADPEKCSKECPVIDSKEIVEINGRKARFFKLHWQYDGVNTPQNFINYVFSIKDKYLVFQLQEVDFTLDIDINHKIADIGTEEIEQFNKIVTSLVLSQ